jgi:hypothetical protein
MTEPTVEEFVNLLKTTATPFVRVSAVLPLAESWRAQREALKAIAGTLDQYGVTNAFAVVTHAKRLAKDELRCPNSGNPEFSDPHDIGVS